MLGIVGKGAYGTVRKALRISTGMFVAVKEVQKNERRNEIQIKSLNEGISWGWCCDGAIPERMQALELPRPS